jgi:DnaJ-class molecular chaperone
MIWSPDLDAPQQIFTCEACEGSGVEVFGTWVYEHGCGFGHNSTDERPCGACNGAGWWVDDASPDPMGTITLKQVEDAK